MNIIANGKHSSNRLKYSKCFSQVQFMEIKDARVYFSVHPVKDKTLNYSVIYRNILATVDNSIID